MSVLDRVPLPGLGTAGGLSERPEGGHEAWFGYTDYTTPPLMLRFDARDSSVHVWATAPGAVAVPPVTARQVTYPSADGTLVRMLVISGAAEPAQPRPALLTGYGGFDISLTPGYSATALAWVEAGGVYAVANLRGGSEEGEEWHRAGMLEHKQNVFDDFRGAAEALIRDGWTTSGQLAISGGSNGGLLVGAALVQRPSLYAAVVCSAPLLDMVRYERFGLGQTWNVEYGSASDPEQLDWLLSYSPYHHVGRGTAYPAVLFTVFTNDTRVDPVHAYKMCAALQDATSSPPSRPVLLRAEGAGGARGARGEPDGGAGRGHARVRGPVHRAGGGLSDFPRCAPGPRSSLAGSGVCGGSLVVSATLTGSCGHDPGMACRLAWDLTHSAERGAAGPGVPGRAGQRGAADRVRDPGGAGRPGPGAPGDQPGHRTRGPGGGGLGPARAALPGARVDPAQRGVDRGLRHRGR